ncbi:hypothetical protein BDU57DRAFT_520884 [Ampelomyces quisqualis]|uniref:UBC core domain-containing protein n=1 Tax=Ampelomyces quisqualis TaxID=50730 RepID=A0A6A5QDX0_AMPQU|nr:hypothetical protein BDU57DRAFT_520884 [Ampelomyces quisqualis]
MSRNGKSRWDSSDYPQDDEDPDFLEALRLSRELNDGPASIFGPSSKPAHYDEDDDFAYAYALELQFGTSHDAQPAQGHASMSTPTDKHVAAPQRATSPWVLKEKEAKTAVYDAGAPTETTFRTLETFFAHIRLAKCSACGYAFFGSELDVRNMLKHWKNGKSAVGSLMKCQICSKLSCIACTPHSFLKQSFVSVKGKQISWCCTGGRLILLWLLLCSLDDHFSRSKSAALVHSSSNQKLRPEPETKGKAGEQSRGRGGGVGFGSRGRHFHAAFMPSGMGYGSDIGGYASYGAGHTLSGHKLDAQSSSVSGKAKALSAQQTEDQFYALHLQLIEALLPSFERETSFDFDPPDATAEMLVESKLLDYCAELLRNDSLEDATKRSEVYLALVSILRTLGAHYATASTVYSRRAVRKDNSNLLTSSVGKYAESKKESTSPLLDNLNNLNVQSKLVLRGAKSNAKEFRTRDGQNLLLLCRQIDDLWAYLDANSDAGNGGEANGKQAKADIPSLLEMPDDKILAAHAHGSAAKALRSNAPGRFKRLITEITSLKTGLPPGIFIRHAESRPDVQKVIIIGPVGTPYENGLFEFDVWCDGMFPKKPPQVFFKTTSGGRVAFNPNLYADGKVCLSLLGTWQGEPWVPNESTLLQVFISIQAMILCEEPWYNEPGRELSYCRGQGEGPSASYNQHIRQHTVRTAMLEWLDKPPALWKDVIDQHFTANADKILHTAVEWSKSQVEPQPTLYAAPFDDDYYDDIPHPAAQSHLPSLSTPPAAPRRFAPPRTDDMATMLKRLQKSLYKYGASEIVSKETLVAPTASRARTTRSSMALPDMDQAVLPPLPLLPWPHFGHPLPTPPPYYTPYDPSGFAPHTHSPHGRGGSSGLDNHRGFSGTGRVLSNSAGHKPQNARGRGGPSHRAAGPELGRYETRSSTRGRGAAGPGTPASNLLHGSFEEVLSKRGRGTHRGRGGRGDRGGRGGIAPSNPGQ